MRNVVRTWGEKEHLLRRKGRGRVLRDNWTVQMRAWEGFEEGVRGLERGLGVDFGGRT